MYENSNLSFNSGFYRFSLWYSEMRIIFSLLLKRTVRAAQTSGFGTLDFILGAYTQNAEIFEAFWNGFATTDFNTELQSINLSPNKAFYQIHFGLIEIHWVYC